MKHADLIKRLIKEALSTPPKKEKCNCGCHSCENVGNKGPVLNESLGARILMTENMKYHVKNKLAITENTFRYGSQAFLDLWAEARYLYSRNAVHLNDEDKSIILETNLGEYGIFEGKKVKQQNFHVVKTSTSTVLLQNITGIIKDDEAKSIRIDTKSNFFSTVGYYFIQFDNFDQYQLFVHYLVEKSLQYKSMEIANRTGRE
jgi:hypothetical protein